MLTTAQALQQFAEDYSKAIVNETGFLPQVCHDEQWSSPCERNEALHGQTIQWQPQQRSVAIGFENIEQALEIPLHQDIKAYYGTMFSGSLFAQFNDWQVELLQVWNDQDLDNLSGNIIGHILMQRKLKQSHTVFIGCLINSEKMLCIDNEKGQVVIETAGNKQREVVADSLLSFFDTAIVLANPESEEAYQQPVEIKAGLMPRLKEVMKSLFGK